MKITKEFIIVGSLIILGALFWVVQNNSGNRKLNFEFPELTPVLTEDVSRVSYKAPHEKWEVNKNKDGEWIVLEEGYSADPRMIERILNSVSSFTFRSIVSKRGENSYRLFGLDKDTRVELTLANDSNTLRTVYLGETSDSLEMYVTFPDDMNTYKVAGISKRDLPLSAEELRSKVIFDIAPDDIVTVKMTIDGDDILEQNKQGNSWSLSMNDKTEDLSPTKITALDNLLSYLNELNANSFVAKDRLTNLEPTVELELKELDGDKYTLTLYEIKGEGETRSILGQSSQSSDPFELSQSTFSRIWDDYYKTMIAEDEKDTEAN